MRRSYRDRDYDFGQRMLVLRSAIGLTQTGLAEYLGISRFAVGEWEAGNKYPKAEHLKTFIELAVQQEAFPDDHQADDIRALWKAAHQKMLIDEQWLTTLLQTRPTQQTDDAPPAGSDGTRVDWGDALAIPNFYGREWELTILTTWIIEKRCRVISTVGLGGIGKSALAVKLMRHVAEDFGVVIWRSLRDAPDYETLIDDVLQVLDPALVQRAAASLDQRLSLLLDTLRNQRVLLVFDNFESILEEKDTRGQMRSGYEGYGELLRRLTETEHQSCLLLTSREKPGDLVLLEGRESPVRSLRLTQLDATSCQQLLAEKDIVGTDTECSRLIEAYTGNPLALKIVAQTIADIFGGEITPFLEQGGMIFGAVHDLLHEQYKRLSPIEQRIALWLAIMREPVTLNQLQSLFVTPLPSAMALETINGLYRHSLIERGQLAGSFTLQSVVLEYLTEQLITEACDEILHGKLGVLLYHGMEQATQVADYIRHIQTRLLVEPLLLRLQNIDIPNLEAHLQALLNQLRGKPPEAQGYAPANLIALLRILRGHLRDLDLSQLVLRTVYLQSIDMQGTNLSNAELRDCALTQTFQLLNSLSMNQTGSYWVTNNAYSQIHVWDAKKRSLYRLWEETSEATIELNAISPDGSLVVGGYQNGTIKLWHVESNALLWTSERVGEGEMAIVKSITFSPDGNIIVVSDSKSIIRFWDAKQGQPLAEYKVPSQIIALAWRNDGTLLATGDMTGTIALWSIGSDLRLQLNHSIHGHQQLINGLAFSPDGKRLASASWDHTVKIWDALEGQLQETLTGHQSWANRIAWSADGRTLASSERDAVILLWDVEHRRYRAVLRGHSLLVKGLAFTPDSKNLVSVSWDATLRVWAVDSGQSVSVLYGYNSNISFMRWSPDSARLAAAAAESVVMIFDLHDNVPPRLLHGLKTSSEGLAWSPDGGWLASSDAGNPVCVWDTATEKLVGRLSHTEDSGNVFSTVAWHPNGQYLAAGTHFKQGIVHCFDMSTSQYAHRAFQPISETGVALVAWSPDGRYLAGAHHSANIYIWDVNGALDQTLSASQETITSFDWNADGRYLATLNADGDLFIWDRADWTAQHVLSDLPNYAVMTWGADNHHIIVGQGDGVLSWWDIQQGICVISIECHQGRINMMQISPDRTMLASCGEDGAIVIRDARTGELLKTLRADRPYERMNITGIRGVTDAQKAMLRALGAIEA